MISHFIAFFSKFKMAGGDWRRYFEFSLTEKNQNIQVHALYLSTGHLSKFVLRICTRYNSRRT